MSTCSNRLDIFLKQYIYNKENNTEFSHTRIGDKKKIYGGAYSIPDDKLVDFYKLYYEHVFVKKNMEYLTEKQNKDSGPILVDFDFRYDNNITKRQHNEGHIIDIIDLYNTKLKIILEFNEQTTFPIYVFEKPSINKLVTENITKDGIHMIIGINMSHDAQLHLRKLVLKEIGDVWGELPLINSWESVLDEGISAGYTNWQLYGSRKPHNEAYQLVDAYNIQYDNNDGEFIFKKINIKKFDMNTNFCKLSAKYKNHQNFTLQESVSKILSAESGNVKLKKKYKKKRTIINEDQLIDFNKISNLLELENAIAVMLENIKPTDYYIKEAHEFAMILPETYWGKDSYNKWIRVGWALKHTHSKLFISWMMMSQKSKDFSYAEISYYYDMWNNFPYKADGLTYRSILYWAKHDADPTEYKNIRKETVDYFIGESLKGGTEFDLGNVLLQLYKDRFICISIKNNIWYEFKHHRWHEIDSGSTLRLGISTDVHQIYIEQMSDLTDIIGALSEDDPKKEKLKKRATTLATIAMKLKQTTNKNNIMREARELFYDKTFLQKQDDDPYLLCFKNGVYDFRENVFRNGKPEDYLTMCTNIDYVPLEKVDKTKLAEVEDFIQQLFPVKELCDYMWQHLSSVCIGGNSNQTFNIYIGSGENGKSKLVEFVGICIGDYKGTVPITLITQKRQSIGGTSSEIVQLRGKRYAVMQEPSKGDVINEGILKEITGGDPLQGRALFKETVTFIPQFKLVVCTNTLFEIKDTGDGTWRRIRVCDFMSKFTDEPKNDDPDKPYQFIKDRTIEKKFPDWKVPFLSKLVDIASKNKGIVKDCKIVMCKSNEYREDQDYLSEFSKEKIEKRDGSRIKKTELLAEFKQWYQLQYGRNTPKGKDLYKYMDSKFGKYQTKGWQNVAIIYEIEEDDSD